MLDHRAADGEGFQEWIGERPAEGNQAMRASTQPVLTQSWPGDFRGSATCATSLSDRTFAWHTAAPEAAVATTFSWIGGSMIYPELTPAYPYVTAGLTIDDALTLQVPLARPDAFTLRQGDVQLRVEPRRFEPLLHWHRSFSPSGVSAVYRLTLPARMLAVGRPVRLRWSVAPRVGCEATVYVMPRRDCLRQDLQVLRDEVSRLQEQMIATQQVLVRMAALQSPDLFPERVRGEQVLVTQDPVRHLHPATITAMRDGELIVTTREAVDHLARDGRMMLIRSRDGGRTWEPRELMFDVGRSDHRNCPVIELPNGDWVGLDYRPGAPGGIYDATGYRTDGDAASLFAAWSTDRGRTWHLGTDPITVPGAPRGLVEVERHPIVLPGGRLLAAGNYYQTEQDCTGIVLLRSDDQGRHWQVHATIPMDPRQDGGEPTLLRTRSGKILLLVRTCQGLQGNIQALGGDWRASGDLLQTESTDEGQTWSAYRSTGLSSLNTPGHLLQLADGRILCSHAARQFPNAVYLTTSPDEGRTWDTARTRVATIDLDNFDCTYPTSAQLPDGTIVTVWYGNMFGKFFIRALRHRPEDL